MVFIVGLVALICTMLGIGLILADANLLGEVANAWNQFLAFIDGTQYPFSKGVILLVLAAVFFIIMLWIINQRDNKKG